jgi:hypothetical protein
MVPPAGTVVAVSPVAIDPAGVRPGLELTEPVFRVKVQLSPLEGRAGAPSRHDACRLTC